MVDEVSWLLMHLEQFYKENIEIVEKNKRWDEITHRLFCYKDLSFYYSDEGMCSFKIFKQIQAIHSLKINLVGVYSIYLTDKSKQKYPVGIFRNSKGDLSKTYLRNLSKGQDCGIKPFDTTMYDYVLDMVKRPSEVGKTSTILKRLYENPEIHGTMGDLSWVDFNSPIDVVDDNFIVTINDYKVPVNYRDFFDRRKLNENPILNYLEVDEGLIVGETPDFIECENQSGEKVKLFRKSEKVKLFDNHYGEFEVSVKDYVSTGGIHPKSTYSLYEKFVGGALDSLGISYTKESPIFINSSCYRWDFLLNESYLPWNVIEVDGIQHFKKNKFNDYLVQQNNDLTKQNTLINTYGGVILRLCVPYIKELVKMGQIFNIQHLIRDALNEPLVLTTKDLHNYLKNEVNPLFPSLNEWFLKNGISHPCYKGGRK